MLVASTYSFFLAGDSDFLFGHHHGLALKWY